MDRRHSPRWSLGDVTRALAVVDERPTSGETFERFAEAVRKKLKRRGVLVRGDPADRTHHRLSLAQLERAFGDDTARRLEEIMGTNRTKQSATATAAGDTRRGEPRPAHVGDYLRWDASGGPRAYDAQPEAESVNVSFGEEDWRALRSVAPDCARGPRGTVYESFVRWCVLETVRQLQAAPRSAV